MIARPKIDAPSSRSGSFADAADWTSALEKLTETASALSDSCDRLRAQFDQALSNSTNDQLFQPTDPSQAGPPSPPLSDLAARISASARQINDRSNDVSILETLTNALELMNEFAAQTASQDEVRELAEQIETLRIAVNTISTRASLNRLS